MGLDALVSALEHDANAAGEAVLARATSEAAALRLAMEGRVAREREARRLDVERRHAVSNGAEVAVAAQAARHRVLEAERAWLDGVRAEAAAALMALPLARWAAGIPVLVGTALRYAGARAITLRCHPDAEDAVWDIAGRREETSVRAVSGMPPGLLLTTDDGRLAVPLTAPDRLAVRWPDLQHAVLARLEELP